ncbi:MAG: carotenoid oxygenase [Lentisphaerales bacterium]|jgi:phosphoglycolate phosphatase|nr:MAG: carotenoid oxygenase [Lentisphaerales bacterium]
MPNVLIFDFDGTIADTYHYIVNISNSLAPEFGYSLIRSDEVDALRDKTIKEVIRHLKVPILKIPAIVARGKNDFLKDISQVQPAHGLIDVLHELKRCGMRMGILSSNTALNITRFLESHRLTEVFDFIQSTFMIWSKNISIRKILMTKGLSVNDVLYIGDEARDILAAKKAGVRSVSVTWGYNSAVPLEAHEPDYLLSRPEELLQFCHAGG